MDGVLDMTQTCWSVIEFTKSGPQSQYMGHDFEASRALYESLENAMWTEIHGRDENCQPVVGVMTHNIDLGRKFYGVEQITE